MEGAGGGTGRRGPAVGGGRRAAEGGGPAAEGGPAARGGGWRFDGAEGGPVCVCVRVSV